MPGSGVTISYANITGNRGYGVFLNSTRGDITLQHSSITNNMADGVKLHVHDRRPETKVIDGVDVHDFCTYSTSYTQTYPVWSGNFLYISFWSALKLLTLHHQLVIFQFLMVAEQYGDSQVSRWVFSAISNKKHFLNAALPPWARVFHWWSFPRQLMRQKTLHQTGLHPHLGIKMLVYCAVLTYYYGWLIRHVHFWK